MLSSLAVIASVFLAALAAQDEKPLQVGIVVLEGVYNTELTAPMDIFHHTVFHTKPGMHVFTIGRTPDPVRSFEGLRILPDYGLNDAPSIDLLVVPSAEKNMTSDLGDARLIEFLRERGRLAKWVMSLCDGAFVLAKAGLLEGRVCTTFPGDIPEFRKMFPHLDVREGMSFVQHESVFTSAGGARSFDVALALCENLYGKPVAEGIARGLVIEWSIDDVAHTRVDSNAAANAKGRPTCWLPGERIDLATTVENVSGEPLALASLLSEETRLLVLYFFGGGESGTQSRRGGLFCEDTFNDLPMLRYLSTHFKERGVRFVPIACPPVFHEERFGYEKGSFRSPDPDIGGKAREAFVKATLAARDSGVLPFEDIYFDSRFELLGHGRFKWYEDRQTYGTPTLWVIARDGEVIGTPFFGNNWEAKDGMLRYTARDVEARLIRALREKS